MQNESFFQRLLSRKLLVTIGAILTALMSGATTTHTIIVAVVAAVYVVAEAALDASNKRDVMADLQRGIALGQQAQASTASTAQPVVVNVNSIPPPPAVPHGTAGTVHLDLFEKVRRGEMTSEDAARLMLDDRRTDPVADPGRIDPARTDAIPPKEGT